MGFAQPLALWFFALFIPVILLYLLKRRRRRVQVSTLMFWDKILRDEQTVTSISRLKKLLSLLLQLLFITLLALSLARPLLSEKITGARRIVLFLDTSASMLAAEGKRTRFDLAKEKAADVVRGMSMGDTMMIAAVSSQPDIIQPFSDSKRDLLEAIDLEQATHSATDFSSAMNLLPNLPDDERETFVYLISDGAFSPVEIDPPERTSFAYLPIGSESDNVGITAFQVRPLPASPRDFQILVEAANHTERDVAAPLELRVNGALIDAVELSIPAGARAVKTLSQFSQNGGVVEAVLDYDDAFPLDNRAFAKLPAPDPVSVELVMESNLFLETALLTDDVVILKSTEPDLYQPTNDYELTIFAGWAPETTPAGNAIFINAWPHDLGVEKLGDLERPIITDWDREHPINQHVSLLNVTIERAAALKTDDMFAPLISSFDSPLALLKEESNRKVMVIAFDTLSSDFPLRVAFPIMMANAIRHLAGREMGGLWEMPTIGEILRPGDLDRFRPSNEINDASLAIAALINPDESRIDLSERNALIAVSYAGLYFGETPDGGMIPVFAANLNDRDESRIAPSATIPLKSKKEIAQITDGFRLGIEPWFFLALIALILIVAEWGLFHRRVIE